MDFGLSCWVIETDIANQQNRLIQKILIVVIFVIILLTKINDMAKLQKKLLLVCYFLNGIRSTCKKLRLNRQMRLWISTRYTIIDSCALLRIV